MSIIALENSKCMEKAYGHIVLGSLLLLAFTLAGCGRGNSASQGSESLQAKQLLQGVWSDKETESIVFKMEGDSVYYPDSTSMTAYFMVVGDTLYIGPSARYHIEKQTEHLLWFTSQNGDMVKLVKKVQEDEDEVFDKVEPQIQTLTEVLKRDTVIYHNGRKYHLYIAVNPTKYRVSRSTVNEDGLSVENVYYDNIIHLSIFQDANHVFSRDFRKQFFERQLPAGTMPQLILNNMEYRGVDADGFHLDVSLCVPGDASCYLIEQQISFDGRIHSKLIGY